MPVVLHARVVSGTGGGPDKTILNSPRFLEPAGYRALCAYMHPPGDPGLDHIRSRAEAWGAPLLSIPDRGPWDWRVASRLLEVCRLEGVSIWHAHDYKSNALGLLLARARPMRLVTTVHGWVKFTRRTPLYYAIDRLCLRHYERVICVSEDLREACLASGVPGSRCELIENAVDTHQFTRRTSREEAKRRIGLRPDQLVVGAIGRLSAEKGFDILIEATGRLIRGGIDVALIIAGEGDEEQRLEELAAASGLRGRVHLLGFRQDTAVLFEAMDIFALSSLREGLPNVLLEAMAMGVPVVATRIAGVPGLIRHGSNGLLVEPGSPEALAGALTALLADDALRGGLQRAGRATVETSYGFEARMRKVLAVYDGLLMRRGGHAGNCDTEHLIIK
jgi:glycosyltransferase involved in cell wall biosynthesis